MDFGSGRRILDRIILEKQVEQADEKNQINNVQNTFTDNTLMQKQPENFAYETTSTDKYLYTSNYVDPLPVINYCRVLYKFTTRYSGEPKKKKYCRVHLSIKCNI